MTDDTNANANISYLGEIENAHKYLRLFFAKIIIFRRFIQNTCSIKIKYFYL